MTDTVERGPDGRHPDCWACRHDGPLTNGDGSGAWFHLPIFSAAGPKLPCPCPPPGTTDA